MSADIDKIFERNECDDVNFTRLFENARRLASYEPMIDLDGFAISERKKLFQMNVDPNDYKHDKQNWMRFAYF